MSSPASIAKHPIHPMLVGLPIGLFVFSLVADVIYLAHWGGPDWSAVAYYTMYGGVVTALMAAIPGFIDYFGLGPKGPRKDATTHMIINLTVVVLYVVNLYIRGGNPTSPTVPLVLSILGVVMLGVSGWLGGEMVYVHGVAVEPQGDTREELRDKDRITDRARYGKTEVRTEEERIRERRNG